MKQWAIALAVVAPLAIMPAAAQTLDTDSAKKVLVGKTWVQPSMAGPGANYWSWKPDGSVCVRLFDPKQDRCDDTGKWTLKTERVCYELEWWGEGYLEKSGCFRIAPLTKGRYAARRDDGLRMFEFALLE